jgi:hypothetical protein
VKTGSLGDAKNFKDVVSHASDAQGVLYVSLDGAWADALRKSAAEQDDKDAAEVARNLTELRALGASVWTDGDTSHGLVRVVLK